MELFIFLGSLFAFLFTGMPIAIVLFICCLILLWFLDMGDLPYQLSFQVVSGTDNYILMVLTDLCGHLKNPMKKVSFFVKSCVTL